MSSLYLQYITGAIRHAQEMKLDPFTRYTLIDPFRVPFQVFPREQEHDTSKALSDFSVYKLVDVESAFRALNEASFL